VGWFGFALQGFRLLQVDSSAFDFKIERVIPGNYALDHWKWI
jgi:hypothetical protein